MAAAGGFLETSPRLFARITGAVYLLYFAAAVPLAQRAAMVVPGDPALTAAHILANERLYRLTVVTELAGFAAYLALTALLYVLLKPVNRPVALIAASFSFAGCFIGAANVANAILPLLLLQGGPSLAAFRPDQLQALCLVALRMFNQVYDIALVFFACFLFLAGYLVWASRFLPRLLGVLLMLASLGWLAWVGAVFLGIGLTPAVAHLIMGVGILGEAVLALWLVLFGVNATAWKQQADRTNRTAASL